MAIHSEEVNYLVYRYLQESGFEHTAFAFAYESRVADTRVYDEFIPPGLLVTYLQKALQYIELETHVRDDGSEVDCTEPFSLIHHHKCCDRKKDRKGAVSAAEIESKEIPASKVVSLSGHKGKVYSCKWSPLSNELITGSSDSSVCLWNTEAREVKKTLGTVAEEGENDITSIDWSANGKDIVSASYKGEVCLWSPAGELQQRLDDFKHPVFTACFSPDGDRLLVSGALPSFYVYGRKEGAWQLEADTGVVNEREKSHHGLLQLSPNLILLNACWRNNSEVTLVDHLNRIINVRLQSQSPIQLLSGHEGEISTIDWNADRSVLLSGADDGVIKLWNDTHNEPVYEFLTHTAGINQVLGNAVNPAEFFSCSNDKTVKVFDIAHLTTIGNFTHHDAPVTHIAQSHGEFASLLATAGLDKYLYFVDVRTQQLVRSHQCRNHVYDMAFSASGDCLAVVGEESSVCILDLRV